MPPLFYAVGASYLSKDDAKILHFFDICKYFCKKSRKKAKKEKAPQKKRLSRIKSGEKEERRSGCYPEKWTKPKRRDTRQRKEQKKKMSAYNADEIDEEKTRQRRWRAQDIEGGGEGERG